MNFCKNLCDIRGVYHGLQVVIAKHDHTWYLLLLQTTDNDSHEEPSPNDLGCPRIDLQHLHFFLSQHEEGWMAPASLKALRYLLGIVKNLLLRERTS